MGLFRRGASKAPAVEGGQPGVSAGLPQLVDDCYCPNGHRLISSLASFGGFPGITVKLRSSTQEGLLSLSPIVGDKERKFFNFERVEGEIIEICCPTCSEALPIYNLCTCGAYLVALFSSPEPDFAHCVGICQRIGCLHSEIKSNRELRRYSRNLTF